MLGLVWILRNPPGSKDQNSLAVPRLLDRHSRPEGCPWLRNPPAAAEAKLLAAKVFLPETLVDNGEGELLERSAEDVGARGALLARVFAQKENREKMCRLPGGVIGRFVPVALAAAPPASSLHTRGPRGGLSFPLFLSCRQWCIGQRAGSQVLPRRLVHVPMENGGGG